MVQHTAALQQHNTPYYNIIQHITTDHDILQHIIAIVRTSPLLCNLDVSVTRHNPLRTTPVVRSTPITCNPLPRYGPLHVHRYQPDSWHPRYAANRNPVTPVTIAQPRRPSAVRPGRPVKKKQDDKRPAPQAPATPKQRNVEKARRGRRGGRGREGSGWNHSHVLRTRPERIMFFLPGCRAPVTAVRGRNVPRQKWEGASWQSAPPTVRSHENWQKKNQEQGDYERDRGTAGSRE
eukprot:gene7985-biopygen4598